MSKMRIWHKLLRLLRIKRKAPTPKPDFTADPRFLYDLKTSDQININWTSGWFWEVDYFPSPKMKTRPMVMVDNGPSPLHAYMTAIADYII